MNIVGIDSSRCQGHGRCVTICPQVFDVADDGMGVVIAQPETERLREDVEEAIASCPESAISWIGLSAEKR